MPSSAQQRQQLGLGVAGPQRVLGLQRGERVDGVGAADRAGASLGQADVPDLALGDQIGQGADGLLDGRVRVDPVLVVQVDVVGAEPLEGALDGGADVGRAAVGDAGPAAGVGDEAELGGHHDLVAAASDGLADQFLAVERAVDLGGVDVGDAQVQRAVDSADRLGVVKAPAAGVGPGHGHGAQADPGDVQPAQRHVLHQVAPLLFAFRVPGNALPAARRSCC